jgi:hypothetical protein
VQDDSRSLQPKPQRTDSNVDRVRNLVRSDGRLGVRLIEQELIMNKETATDYCGDLEIRKFSAKTVSRILTDDQKKTSASHFI